ncbi:MAG: general secretion pathway protein GspK [Proteobacteria bacterium]|nr:general secretion pathway protein GspK [Pseudomonadota bacterium]
MVAAMVSMWALQGVEGTRGLQDEADDAIAIHDTAQTLMYIAATRDFTYAGLPTAPIDRAEYAKRTLQEFGALNHDPVGGEMALDDQPYRGLGESGFSIQDEAGLLGVNWADPRAAGRLLGIAPEVAGQAPALRDALLDYIDEDDTPLPSGGERSAYVALGRTGPANHRMMSPRELHSVLGWDRLPTAQYRHLQQYFTPYYGGAVNLNTAPSAVLATWLPGCPTTCEQVLQIRARTPIKTMDDLQRRLGTDQQLMEFGDYRTMPSDVLRITLWGRNGRGVRMHVRLTPGEDKGAPWAILSSYPIVSAPVHAAQRTGSPLLAAPSPGHG